MSKYVYSINREVVYNFKQHIIVCVNV